MLIQQKKIMNLEKHLGPITKGNKLIIAAPINSETQYLLTKIGFTDPPELGDTVLPSPKFGNISLFNSEGKDIVRRDLPKETAYRQVEWHWEEWRGYGETEEMSKIVDVPYQRYPREFIPPPGVEFSIGSSDEGELFILSPAVNYISSNETLILHIINLFLEIFGFAYVLTDELNEITIPKIKRINWTVLPEGEYPWERTKQLIKPILDMAKEGNRPVLSNRYAEISKYKPDFVAIGKAGFSGYLIFGFKKRNLYVCESAFYGNATYIFESDWEELSKLSKAEILNQERQKDRVIHRVGWERKIKDLLN